MAREFTGSTKYLEAASGTLTGLDTATQSVMVWVYNTGTTGTERVVVSYESAGTSNRRRVQLEAPDSSGFQVSYVVQASTPYRFDSDDVTASVWHSVVVAHNRATTSTVNPTMWVDGAERTVTKVAGNGTISTSDDMLRVGSHNTTNPLSASVGGMAVVNSVVTAGDANRFHWWGCAPGGPSTMLVWLPLWTDNLRNKGTGGNVEFTQTSTTMTAMPKVERCWAASMGVGR